MRIWLGFLLAASLVGGCKTTDSSVNSTESPAAGSTVETGASLSFVGCVPSLGECRMSCPERDGQGQVDPGQCPDEIAPVACGCPSATYVPPVPPNPSEYEFAGCVPSASECRYSCNSKQMITFQGGDGCSSFEFSCYCKL